MHLVRQLESASCLPYFRISILIAFSTSSLSSLVLARARWNLCKDLGFKKQAFACARAVETADLEKLSKLIGICGMLLQTKVYLSWSQCARGILPKKDEEKKGI